MAKSRKLFTWQEAVIEYLLAETDIPDGLGDKPNDRTINMFTGVRVNWGHKAGHTYLAQLILETFPNACLVVPSGEVPYANKKFPKALMDRVWVSAPQDPAAKRGIVLKAFAPLKGADILVIDGAERLSLWELEPLRMAKWSKYVQLQ